MTVCGCEGVLLYGWQFVSWKCTIASLSERKAIVKTHRDAADWVFNKDLIPKMTIQLWVIEPRCVGYSPLENCLQRLYFAYSLSCYYMPKVVQEYLICICESNLQEQVKTLHLTLSNLCICCDISWLRRHYLYRWHWYDDYRDVCQIWQINVWVCWQIELFYQIYDL